jgi:hypothetical protein
MSQRMTGRAENAYGLLVVPLEASVLPLREKSARHLPGVLLRATPGFFCEMTGSSPSKNRYPGNARGPDGSFDERSPLLCTDPFVNILRDVSRSVQ